MRQERKYIKRNNFKLFMVFFSLASALISLAESVVLQTGGFVLVKDAAFVESYALISLICCIRFKAKVPSPLWFRWSPDL